MRQQTGVIIGVTSAVMVAVVVTVTLVLTLQEDDPKPQLDTVVAKGNQGYMVGFMTPQAGIFHGIPFSQPPVGEYRWQKPRDAVPFPGAYWNATYTRPACVQICHQPAEEYSCPPVDGEDCLYLNVFVPSRLLETVPNDEIIGGEHYVIPEEYQQGDDKSLAVMLWLYGGNFINGAGSVPLYDHRFLADQGNIIGVTMNYRVGPLGFMVQGDGADAATGNYGIWDQVKALEWIQDNIKYFGGNPNRVTLFGQSAGAESIGVLMTSPQTPPNLFQQSVMHSNPFGLPFRDFNNAKEYGGRFATAAGCLAGDMECLRKLTPAEIKQAFGDSYLEIVGVEKLFIVFQPWAPVIDGNFLLEQPVDTFMRGEALDIPSIIGGTVDEGMLFIAAAFGSKINNLQYRAIIRAIMKEDSGVVLEEFPPVCRPVVPEQDCDNRYLMNDLATEYLFMCPMRASMFSMGPDTWFYVFNETWSFYELWEIPLCFDAVCHAADLPYVFNMGNLTIYDYTPDEKVMSERMGFYWTNFAKYGNPNGDMNKIALSSGNRLGQITDGTLVDAVYWPRFREPDSEHYYALQIAAEGDYAMLSPYNDTCNFMDEVDSYGDHYF